MKVNREKLVAFQPFKLVLEIETEEEARGLFAIFNHSANCELLPDYLPGQIRAQIGLEHVANEGDVIANGIFYRTFYGSKRG